MSERTEREPIDLRSDTVTKPTTAMLEAMSAAPVGDDVYGEDPTVSRLEAVLAERAGKEAALFFPTGTQSNLAALMAHCGRGDEYLCGQNAHTYKYEGGGAAVLASIQPQPVEHAPDGSLPIEKLAAAIKPVDFHFARTRLLALENTHGGRVLPQAYVAEATRFARERGLSLHLDGARLWNAMVAEGATLAALCAPFDTVSLCFSKGLGTPVGSALVGSRDLIEIARRWRKVLGGGMRQAGGLAAACLHALDHHVARLGDDHAMAARLEEGLRPIEAMRLAGGGTNIRFYDVAEKDWTPLAAHLRADGIVASVGARTRFVTHMGIGPDDVDAVIASFERYFAGRRGQASRAA